jgi:hypothetical protein
MERYLALLGTPYHLFRDVEAKLLLNGPRLVLPGWW